MSKHATQDEFYEDYENPNFPLPRTEASEDEWAHFQKTCAPERMLILKLPPVGKELMFIKRQSPKLRAI